MEPQRKETLLDGDNFYYQVKWDGIRLLAFVQGGKIRLQGKSLKDKTKLYPELAVLPELVKGKSFILDGELVALKGNRPCFYTLMQRELAGEAHISRMAKLVPVNYLVFDILFWENRPLFQKPWEARQEILQKNLVEGEFLHLTPNYRDGGLLLKAVKELGLEGVVAKKKGSPYIPGPKKTSYWLKTKIEQNIEAFVGGLSLRGKFRDKFPASLLLGLEHQLPAESLAPEVKLRYIGSVRGGLKEKELMEWYAWAREHQINEPPFFNPPSPQGGRSYLWMKPERKVKVIFNEWTPDLKLRAPRLALTERGC